MQIRQGSKIHGTTALPLQSFVPCALVVSSSLEIFQTAKFSHPFLSRVESHCSQNYFTVLPDYALPNMLASLCTSTQ